MSNEMKELEMEQAERSDVNANANEVEVEDVIANARRKQERDEEQHRRDLEKDCGRRAQAAAGQEKQHRALVHAVGGAAVFVLAALAVLAGMCWRLVSPVFAIPLAIIWFMRAAVRYDRYARRWSR